jgi:hypothetical protein
MFSTVLNGSVYETPIATNWRLAVTDIGTAATPPTHPTGQ